MSKIRPQNSTNANGKLPFKLKILLIAILPIIAVATLTGWLIHIGANRLIETESTLIEKRILDFRQQELKNYITLALTAIDHQYHSETSSKPDAQKAVQQILHNLNYGDDGYFFAYDRKGTSLVNAPAPDLIGANLWYIKDEGEKYLVQELMRQAVNGGGFTTYIWNKPSTNQKTRKLGYSVYLPKWGWMLGTGLYLDDVEQEVATYRADMRESTRKAETILFLVALLAVVVTAVAVAAVHYNEHKLADTRLKALTRRIVDVQEEERKRVSNDLHDGINQLLVSIRYRVELAIDHVTQPEKSLPLMEKSLSILDTSISDVRRISKALHPSALDNIGLAVAIRELGHDFEESTQIDTNIITDQIGHRLSENAKIAMYRVVQEALTNVAVHASADMVQIELKADDVKRVVSLKISDNGVGFKNPDKLPEGQGLGLRNMVERMESHEGNLTIRNGPLGGVELAGEIPQI